MTSNNQYKYLKIFTIIIISISFFVGFLYRENLAGGAEVDFNLNTWPAIQGLKYDFLNSLKNYGKFNEGSWPLFHIISAYLNPFSSDKYIFQFSNTLLSFFIFFGYAFILKQCLKKIDFLDCLLIASIFLILPFFRSTAFWGLYDNIAWLFFAIACLLLNDLTLENKVNKEKFFLKSLFLFCLFSSLALYTRLQLAFFCISFVLYVFLYFRHQNIVFTTFFFYLIFSIPGIYLIYLWGNIYDETNFGALNEHYIDVYQIPKNFLVILSLFGFYLLPTFFSEFFKNNFSYTAKKYLASFLGSFLFLLILNFTGFLSIFSEFRYGGGAVLKLNNILFEDNYIIFIIFVSLGFSLIFNFLKENFFYNLIFIFPIFIIYGTSIIILQEHFEPLIIILFFLVLKTSLKKNYLKNINFYNLINVTYFVIFFLGSFLYRYYYWVNN